MSFHQSVNNFVFHSIKHVGFHAKGCIFVCWDLWQPCFVGNNMQRWFRRLKNNDLDVENKEHYGELKKFEVKELEALLHEVSYKAQSELAESLVVDHTTVSKPLKALGMIQKQRHWMQYELTPRDVKRHLITCEQLLQLQKKKDFFASYHDHQWKVDTTITQSDHTVSKDE